MTDAVLEPKVKTAPKIVEPTLFDLSSPGRTGVTMPASDVPETALPPHELPHPQVPHPVRRRRAGRRRSCAG